MSQTKTSQPRSSGRRGPSLAGWNKAPVLPRPEECIALAGAALARARQLLLNPTAEAVLQCEFAMNEVADRLRQFPRSLARAEEAGRANRADLQRAAAALKEDLSQVTILYHKSSQFYASWTRLFSAKRCGYTRRGAPARLVCSHQFVVRG